MRNNLSLPEFSLPSYWDPSRLIYDVFFFTWKQNCLQKRMRRQWSALLPSASIFSLSAFEWNSPRLVWRWKRARRHKNCVRYCIVRYVHLPFLLISVRYKSGSATRCWHAFYTPDISLCYSDGFRMGCDFIALSNRSHLNHVSLLCHRHFPCASNCTSVAR